LGKEDRTVSQKMQVSFEGSASIFFGDIKSYFLKKNKHKIKSKKTAAIMSQKR
jgi:hypothetical protein